jgi:NhaD family Na+/H+ antiporter
MGRADGPGPQFPLWLPSCQALPGSWYTVSILRQTNQNRSKAIKIPVVFPLRKSQLMNTLLILIFVLAYAAIAFEHPIKINKSASALLGAGLLWSIYAVMTGDPGHVSEHLGETLVGTAQIVFFLMGAMTIVEVIDAHDGFDVVTARIRTTSLSSLMWLVGIVTFFLSAVLDNLTTAIVMVSLMKKLLDSRDERLLFAGMIVIAANAGGAWSPIGDVTTTMLWIGGQITASSIIGALFFPSLVNLLVPLAIISYSLRGKPVVEPRQDPNQAQGPGSTERERNIMFFLGLGVLIAVPAFKTITHLPPFMGVLLGLGVLWLVGDLLHGNKTEEEREHLNLTSALNRIDMASIVFFIGILLAVATLEHSGILPALAGWLDTTVGRQDLIVLLIGIVSAIVDNVPLVAAAIGMYSLDQYGPNSFLWQFLAYCAGTGGSILIIGSAAGVAAMGLERIDFVWYVKKISGLAIAGYFAGALAYIIQISLFN